MKNYPTKNLLKNLKGGIEYSFFELLKLVPLGYTLNSSSLKDAVNKKEIFCSYSDEKNKMMYYKPITL